MKHRVTMQVDLGVIAENFRKIRRRAGSCPVMAVIKADAYGLGAEMTAPVLRDAGAAFFGAATLTEALQLQKFGLPVLILGCLLPFEMEDAVAAGIHCPVNTPETASLLAAAARKCNRKALCHLQIDSGMGRIGMRAQDAMPWIREIVQEKDLQIEGIFSHFATATAPEEPYALQQLENFLTLIRQMDAEGLTPKWVHMAASGGIGYLPRALQKPFTLARTGIWLGGHCDCEGMEEALGLPVSIKTYLASIKELPAGSSIGYNRMYTLERPARIGTIPMGYADGLPLGLTNRGSVLIRGKRCPIVGRISMDCATVLLDDPAVSVGEEVVMIGAQGTERIGIPEWADARRTHEYEALCAISKRVVREYCSEG